MEVLRRALSLTTGQEERNRYEYEKGLRGNVEVNIVHKKALSRINHLI